MKKLLCAMLIICMCFTSCVNGQGQQVSSVQSTAIYKSAIEMLKVQTGFVSASCPASREMLNGYVAMTSQLMQEVEKTLSQHEPTTITQWHVPGDGKELELVFGDDKAMSLQFYKNDDKTLIWIQNGQGRSQMSADGQLYNALNTLLSGAVVAAQPELLGEYMPAKLLSGRDIPCGFYEKNNVLVSGYSSFDNKGYLDFYDVSTGELTGTLGFDTGIVRVDTGFDGSLRVFANGALHYIDVARQKIKSTFTPPEKNIDTGDSFDVNEKLKVYAYIKDGIVHLCDLKGVSKNVIMETSDLTRSLTAEIANVIEAEEGFVYYTLPRFTGNFLSAIAKCNVEAYPLVGMSSFELPIGVLKMLERQQLEKDMMEEFYVFNFPSIFGKLGSLTGYEGETAVVKCDDGTAFANMRTGEESLMLTTPRQRVVPVGNGMICVQTVEQLPQGISHTIDISLLSDTEAKVNLLTASAMSLSIEGTTGNTLVLKEGAGARLLLVPIKSE